MFFDKKIQAEKEQLVGLHTRIEERSQELADIEQEIAAKREELGLLDAIPNLKAKKAELEQEIDDLSARLQILVDMEGMREEQAALNQELVRLKQEVGIYQSLRDIREEVKGLEVRRRMLAKYPKRKFDPRKIVLAAYVSMGDEDAEPKIGAFVYKGDAIYTDEDGVEHYCTEYASIGGSRWAALDTVDYYYLGESDDRAYNTAIKEYVTFEDICQALGNYLYLEDWITIMDINKMVELLSSYYCDEESNYALYDILNLLQEQSKEKQGRQRINPQNKNPQ
ncbi:MAG: hypothetical protein K2J20_04685 [Bacilli bacterium]|nr:hypothetical protein [Bacilli bacterium]